MWSSSRKRSNQSLLVARVTQSGRGVAAKWWVYLWETVTTTKCSMYIYTYVYCWQLGRGIPLNENTWQTDESSSHLSYVYTCVCMYVLWRFDDHTLTITSTFIKNERAHERNNTAARVTNTPPPTLTASWYSFVVEIKKSRHFCGVEVSYCCCILFYFYFLCRFGC